MISQRPTLEKVILPGSRLSTAQLEPFATEKVTARPLVAVAVGTYVPRTIGFIGAVDVNATVWESLRTVMVWVALVITL